MKEQKIKQRKKIFFDMEFTGLHQETTLISIGLISECGTKHFYGETNDFDKSQINEWLQTNVIDNLSLQTSTETGIVKQPHFNENKIEIVKTLFFGNSQKLRYHLEEWLYQFGEVEMWSDCLAYDWVLFNQIWEHAFNIPKNVYYIPFDICTLFHNKRIDPDINREEYADMLEGSQKHNALWDAMVIRACFNKLNKTP